MNKKRACLFHETMQKLTFLSQNHWFNLYYSFIAFVFVNLEYTLVELRNRELQKYSNYPAIHKKTLTCHFFQANQHGRLLYKAIRDQRDFLFYNFHAML